MNTNEHSSASLVVTDPVMAARLQLARHFRAIEADSVDADDVVMRLAQLSMDHPDAMDACALAVKMINELQEAWRCAAAFMRDAGRGDPDAFARCTAIHEFMRRPFVLKSARH